ncbi:MULTISPECIES: YxD-tail cyclophane-containing RiPP peptide [unclassified Streptomyces]|uniref:YxD-tail cyclophane-containing RiPP peptide n=1 Tax=unclassified Streptomyces TaxID=2593676 RepID=UPI0037AC02E8
MTPMHEDSSSPLPSFGRLAALAEDGGTTGHPVLDAVLTGLRKRSADAGTPVAYYEDAP